MDFFMWIGFVLISLIFGIVYFFHFSKWSYWRKLGIPGPTPVPIFGNMLSYVGRTSFDVQKEWYEKYGDIYGYYDGSFPILSLSNPDTWKDILYRDGKYFCDHFVTEMKMGNPIIEKNIAFTVGENYKRIRSIFTMAFTPTRIKATYTSSLSILDKQIKLLKSQLGANGCQTLDFNAVLGRLNLDIVSNAFFRKSCKPEEVDELVLASRYFFARTIWSHLLYTVFGTWAGHPPFFTNDAVNKTAKVCERFFNERRQDPLKGTYGDYADCLLEYEKIHSGDGSKKFITAKEVEAQSALAIASCENFTNILTNVFYHLSINPDVQSKLYKEVVGSTLSTYDDIDHIFQLPYLNGVVKEALRDHMEVFMIRASHTDYPIKGTNITLPKGFSVGIPLHALNHDPKYFDKPYEFNPERWIDSSNEKLEVMNELLLPFGAGLRSCLGQKWAIPTMKLIIVGLVQNFEYSNGQPMKYSLDHLITTCPVESIINVKLRKD